MSDLPVIADELYGRAPTEFTAARNARAREAAAQGDRALAEAIRHLTKPAASAWAVNALVRQRADEVGEVLRLGAAMREAQAELDRDELAKLGQQRRKLVGALTRSATELAANLGQRVSTAAEVEVKQTLLAAMADERAARTLLSGRLLRALESVGFDEVDLAGAVAVPEDAGSAATASTQSAPAVADREPDRERQRDRDRARRELANAEQRAGDLDAEVAALDGRITRQARRREFLDGELAELREQLHGVERDIGATVEERRALERERDRMQRAAAEAQRVAERAQAHLDRLS